MLSVLKVSSDLVASVMLHRRGGCLVALPFGCRGLHHRSVFASWMQHYSRVQLLDFYFVQHEYTAHETAILQSAWRNIVQRLCVQVLVTRLMLLNLAVASTPIASVEANPKTA